VNTAIVQNPLALRYASDELRGDRRLALYAVSHHCEATACVGKELWTDSEFVLSAVEINPSAIRHASPALRADPAFRNLLAGRSPHVMELLKDSVVQWDL